MFKVISLLAVSIVMVWACTKKVAPESAKVNNHNVQKAAQPENQIQSDLGQKTEEQVENPDKEKGKPPTSEPGSVPAARPLPPPNLPKGPEKASEVEMGKNIYTTKCKKCHSVKNVKNYSFAQWESILKTMVPNANLSQEEEGYLIAYIRANAK